MVAISPISGLPPPPLPHQSDNLADSVATPEDPGTLVKKPVAAARLNSLAHFEWMEEIESDLAGLSREALISVLLEVVSAFADTVPIEVESAKAEVSARLTKNYGDELFRMEEQYELVI